MSAGQSFNTVAGPDGNSVTGRRRKPATRPFSIRLTTDERSRLLDEAEGLPLGSYIRAKLLGCPPPRRRRSGLAIVDQHALAKVLALLGKSKLSSNLNQLAHLGHISALPVDETVGTELREAADEIRSMRHCLLQALGLATTS